MNWNDVPLFLAIAEETTLAGAARRLSVNHSTVFRRLQALESDLAVRLFDRLPEGYRLTAEGEAMLAPAREAAEAMDTLQRKLAGRDVELTGRVRVTAPPAIALRYLPEVLTTFADRFPAIQVDLAVSDRDLDLGRREADIAVRATAAPPEHLVGRRVCDLPWRAVASPAYLAAEGRPDGPTELAAHRLIGADDEFTRLQAFAWLRRIVPEEVIRFRSNDLNTMAALARAGAGIALLPLDQPLDGLESLFPVCSEATSGLWLLTHPDLRQTARVRALVRHIAEALGKDPRLVPPAG